MSAMRVSRAGAIERTAPMKIHKAVVIEHLTLHPGDFAEIAPAAAAEGHTVEAYLLELRAAAGEWFVGGVLE